MSDGEALFAVLFLLYLSECFLWIKSHSVAFVSPWGGRWRVKLANSLFGGTQGGLLLMNPLPPLGRVLLCHLSPVSISPAGMCAYNLQSLPGTGQPIQSGKFFAFDEIAGVSSHGSHLLVNNTKFVKCATPEQARSISSLIDEAIHASPADREVLVQSFIDKQFDKKDALAKLGSATSFTATLKWICIVFFVYLFLLVPILVSVYGLTWLMIPIAALMVAFAVQISVMFYSVHKALYPDLNEDRISNVAKMLLCPPVSIRAVDLLTANSAANLSPIVVADLLSGSDAKQFVRLFILDLKYCLGHELSDHFPIEIAKWYARQQLKHCLEYIDNTGNFSSVVLFAPPPNDGSSTAYCPRCESQFITGSGECPDCPGVKLLVYPDCEVAEKADLT